MWHENKWHYRDAPLNLAIFYLKFLPRIWTGRAYKRKAWLFVLFVGIRCTAQFVIRQEKRYDKTRLLHISNKYFKIWREQVARCHAQFCEFRSGVFHLVFEANVQQTNGRPSLCWLFSDKLWSILYFSGSLYRPYISRTTNGKRKCRLSVCWFVHDQHCVKKTHLNS